MSRPFEHVIPEEAVMTRVLDIKHPAYVNEEIDKVRVYLDL